MPHILNHLLEGLPRAAYNRILHICEPIDLVFGTTLCEADTPIRWIYFPLHGFISLVTTLRDHQPLEMGLIGNEGMLGATMALGVSITPMQAIVQGKGSALRMSADQLHIEMHNTPMLMNRIHRYLYMMMTQLAQTAACAHFHEIEPRLARWLLMTHDRAHSDHFHLTQEYLSHMLGVRRSGVTVAAGALQNKKLIHYSRGEIHILNRAGLEAAACECYATVANTYQRIYNEKVLHLCDAFY